MSLSPSQRTQFLSLLSDIEACPTEELRKAAARLRFIREIREYRNSERFLNIAIHRELFDRGERP